MPTQHRNKAIQHTLHICAPLTSPHGIGTMPWKSIAIPDWIQLGSLASIYWDSSKTQQKMLGVWDGWGSGGEKQFLQGFRSEGGLGVSILIAHSRPFKRQTKDDHGSHYLPLWEPGSSHRKTPAIKILKSTSEGRITASTIC